MRDRTVVDSVGEYELVEDVSAGRVWRGWDPSLERPVAVKRTHGDTGAERGATSREAHLLATLAHPDIVSVIDLVTGPDGSQWLVEEWVDGVSLADLVTRGTRLTGPQAVGVVQGALRGLAHAHEHGVVHGDVTPANMLLDSSGITRLIDFGLARPTGALAHGGTPGYLSPETLRGEPVTPAADVYSAAAVLAALLLGRPVFDGRTAAEALAAQLGREPDLSGLPPALRRVVGRALSPWPEHRPPDASVLLADLEAAASADLGPHWARHAGVAGLVGAAIGASTAAASTATSTGASATLTAKVAAAVGAAVVLGGVTVAAVHHERSRPSAVAATIDFGQSGVPVAVCGFPGSPTDEIVHLHDGRGTWQDPATGATYRITALLGPGQLATRGNLAAVPVACDVATADGGNSGVVIFDTSTGAAEPIGVVSNVSSVGMLADARNPFTIYRLVPTGVELTDYEAIVVGRLIAHRRSGWVDAGPGWTRIDLTDPKGLIAPMDLLKAGTPPPAPASTLGQEQR